MRRLSELAQAALDLPADKRRTLILRPKWVDHPMATRIFGQLEDVLEYPRMHRMPNLLIYGDTNNGKTSIVNEFQKRHPGSDRPEDEASQIPVVVVQMPPVPDERRFYRVILRHLRIPHGENENAQRMHERLCGILPKLGVRMLVLDEIHNILAGGPKSQERFLTGLRWFCNDLQLPVVGVGTPAALNAIVTDPQLDNRFKRVPLQRWSYGMDFKGLLNSFEMVLPLRQASDLRKPELARRLFDMSGAVIGELVTIVNEAAIHAIGCGEERITLEILETLGFTAPDQRRDALVDAA